MTTATANEPRKISFFEELQEQRWDDHRYYHQSRVNQALHLLSACCFVGVYVMLLFKPALASIIFRPLQTNPDGSSPQPEADMGLQLIHPPPAAAALAAWPAPSPGTPQIGVVRSVCVPHGELHGHRRAVLTASQAAQK